MSAEYTLRWSERESCIDIVPAGAHRHDRALVIVPVSIGKEWQAEEFASLICQLLNEQAKPVGRMAARPIRRNQPSNGGTAIAFRPTPTINA